MKLLFFSQHFTLSFFTLLNQKLTKYSLLNSYSAKASCFSSHESSKAVSMGSLLDKAINEGEARALYALILLRECRKLSSIRDTVQSSQPHLKIMMNPRHEVLVQFSCTIPHY